MKSTTKSKLSILLVSAFVLISAGAASGNPADSESCVSCHKNMINDSINRMSVHQPFMGGKCNLCHGGSESSRPNSNRSDNSSETTGNSKTRIKWLDESRTKANIQWFRIPSSEVKNALYVTTSDRKTTNIRLDVPQKKNIAALSNNSVPPVLDAVKVAGIEKGLFITATISWKTDKISDSLVTFNAGGRISKSFDRYLTTDHRVSLIGLKPDQDYTYTVASTDVFGNVAKSESFTFSTRAAKVIDKNSRPEWSREKANITSEIFTANSDLIVKISTDRPASLAIGTDMQVAPKKINTKSSADTANVHGAMQVNINKTVALCVSCHKDHNGGRSHPVDVYPTQGMIIPADYPTSDDGKITCLTCHNAHSSNLKYMLRKSNERELCIGCHRDKDDDRPAKGLMVKQNTGTAKNS